MSLALIIHYLSVFSKFFPELQALLTRIWAEMDKDQTDNDEVSALQVMGDTINFSPSFIDDLRNNHGDALVALETAYDQDGEAMMSVKAFGSGSLLKILPFIIQSRDLIDGVMNLIAKYRDGSLKLADLFDLLEKSQAMPCDGSAPEPAVEDKTE